MQAESELNTNLTPFAVTQPFKMPEQDVDRDVPRSLFTAANLVSPQAARDRGHLAAGGVELWNPCLRASGMFIRRGTITPLLMDTLTPIPSEEANLENTQFFAPQPRGHVEDQGYVGPLQSGGPLLGYPARPGDQIGNILDGPENVDGTGPRGLVEITSLKGHNYRFTECPIPELGLVDLKIWEIQKSIFPDYPILPVTLAKFREQIETSHAKLHSMATAKKVAEEMIVSCDIFGLWATRAIEEIHQAMNNAAAKGYVFPYEGIHFALLEQLGMERQDLHYRNVAAKAPQTPFDAQGLIGLFKTAFDASREESREEFKAFARELFDEFRKEDKPKKTKAA